MTYSDRIATLDLSDLDGVVFVHRQDVAAPHEDYIIIEMHYRGASQQVLMNWTMPMGLWKAEKTDLAQRFKRRVDAVEETGIDPATGGRPKEVDALLRTPNKRRDMLMHPKCENQG